MNNPFKNSELTHILVVNDIKESLNFYVNQLNAEVFREYEESVVINFLDNWLLLVNSGDPTADKPDIYFSPPEQKNEVSHSFTIRVDNCKESYDILLAKGVKFITPPYDRDAEIRCFFYDPNGHLFEISEFKG